MRQTGSRAGWWTVAAAIALLTVGCSTSDATTVTGDTSSITPQSTPASTTTITVTTTTPATTDAATAAPPPPVSIPSGGVALVPEGPYDEGEAVTLLASDDEFIDLYNSSPRLCASVDDGEEYCDPSWIPPRPVGQPPLGTTGVSIELPQWHFGPGGYNDCADDSVVCRLAWQTEAGRLLTTQPLTYEHPANARPTSVNVTNTEVPGVVQLSIDGLDTSAIASDVFSVAELADAIDAVEDFEVFDEAKQQLSWHVGGVCSFETGDPPIGSEGLEDPPTWWAVNSVFPTPDSTPLSSFYGGTCDWNAVDGERKISDNGTVELQLRRNIYGYRGWVDCAATPCYLSIGVRWLYPMSDGSSLGFDMNVEHGFVTVSDQWPSVQPSISIVEPGPYKAGDNVTVEVRDHHSTEDGLAIGWCPGGDSFCGYQFSSYEDGVHSVNARLSGSAESCGLNRCYFEIDSASEGMAPPAIVIVPFE